MKLTVVTPSDEDNVIHLDASGWTVTPDERLVILGAVQTENEAAPSTAQPLAEYARGSWRSVQRDPEPQTSS